MAAFDVQWGNVQRPHTVTASWELGALPETYAHKWGRFKAKVIMGCLERLQNMVYDIHDNVIRSDALERVPPVLTRMPIRVNTL